MSAAGRKNLSEKAKTSPLGNYSDEGAPPLVCWKLQWSPSSSAVGTPSIFIMLPDITREIQTELKWKSWPVAKVIDTDCCSYKILLCHFAERCWLFLCVAEIRVEFESDLADSFLRRLILQFVTCERSGTGIQRVFCVMETAGSAGKEKRLR